MNHVTICIAKCLGVVTLKVLPKSSSRYTQGCYNTEDKSLKFPTLNITLHRINASLPVQVL